MIGENVKEVLESNLKLEQLGLVDLRDAIGHCESVHDFVSRSMPAEIMKAEEEHIDFIETQLALIPKIGMENYIQLQSSRAESED